MGRGIDEIGCGKRLYTTIASSKNRFHRDDEGIGGFSSESSLQRRAVNFQSAVTIRDYAGQVRGIGYSLGHVRKRHSPKLWKEQHPFHQECEQSIGVICNLIESANRLGIRHSQVHGHPPRAVSQRRRTIKFFEREGRINTSQRPKYTSPGMVGHDR